MALKIFGSVFSTSVLNPNVLKCHFNIVENILFKVSSSKDARDTRVKCLKIRGVINDLPPPGGPIAVTNIVLIILLNGFSLSLCSYHPP